MRIRVRPDGSRALFDQGLRLLEESKDEDCIWIGDYHLTERDALAINKCLMTWVETGRLPSSIEIKDGENENPTRQNH